MKTTQDSTQPVPEAPVERHDPVQLHEGGGSSIGQMESRHDGDWVRYEDYEKLRQELNAARSILDYLRGARVYGGSRCQPEEEKA